MQYVLYIYIYENESSVHESFVVLFPCSILLGVWCMGKFKTIAPTEKIWEHPSMKNAVADNSEKSALLLAYDDGSSPNKPKIKAKKQ